MNAIEPMRRAIAALGGQQKLADLVGRKQSWVSQVAAGKIASISVDDAFAIERATNGAVGAAEFAGLAPAAPPSPPQESAA